ncbi:HopJ type III effector protein [Zunongwangia sp. F363]|uniref:HopJ type III effector protein n=1 Tax=Autumnicola tepida TaxID=3075595 RepID=A0ABU3CB86_9FLAO|nr:HopJ type III effector protein [Zunongwangia sp. F363]MDT0643594.1 HopJ type III effector protein [Zunongwangia sp. F363]
MKTEEFISALKANPRANTFAQTMEVIDENYKFTPVAFNNGSLENVAGENNGSCRIFAFAKLKGLNKEETLACFGEIYFGQVLQNPEGESHQNIRNFMKSGWDGIQFKEEPLQLK